MASSLSSSSVNPLESNGVLSAILSFQGIKGHQAQATTDSLCVMAVVHCKIGLV